ncbi:heme-binding protein [Polynucleobacter sp. 71A-WALBACH]|uniref:SOUL family heme-binding protein n=1 Tax=Polynucleobacter sp. 71A-WALBACH TaxID=2689097 RepID=UPI0021051F08|nr:heme-binding protein [Polynucleobacter sp. 71A-WALBACH]
MKDCTLRVLVFLTSILIASAAMATEEPKYVLLEKSEPFELRAYAPLIVAEVKVDGDLDAASAQGFRLIAAYIFGKNQVAEKIAMTAPVGIESGDQNKSAKIAMTAPVKIEGGKPLEAAGNQWTVSFVMPAEYTLASLPKPLNPQINIREVPAEKRAVIIFSGFYNEEKVQEKTQALREWMKTKNLKPAGEPQFARYNPPWTLPFMRRNEIMIQVLD